MWVCVINNETSQKFRNVHFQKTSYLTTLKVFWSLFFFIFPLALLLLIIIVELGTKLEPYTCYKSTLTLKCSFLSWTVASVIGCCEKEPYYNTWVFLCLFMWYLGFNIMTCDSSKLLRTWTIFSDYIVICVHFYLWPFGLLLAFGCHT